jgi:hypothetical protein
MTTFAADSETAVTLRSVQPLRRSRRSFVPPRSSIELTPMIPKPVYITRVDEIIAKRVETTLQPARPVATLSFSWDARVFQPTPNTVYLATLKPDGITTTLEQVAHYDRIGVPHSATVIVGNYRDLGYQEYAALKRTGAVLKRIQSDLTQDVRARVEQELTPVFRNIFDLAPAPRFSEREYRYKAAPQLSQDALDQLVARINDPGYRPTDE